MINGELIVDNFAGGGGASTGIEMDEPCFNCDDCIHWDGKTGREMWRDECP